MTKFILDNLKTEVLNEDKVRNQTSKKTITFTVVELNKPSKSAIDDLNKLAYSFMHRDIKVN